MWNPVLRCEPAHHPGQHQSQHQHHHSQEPLRLSLKLPLELLRREGECQRWDGGLILGEDILSRISGEILKLFSDF